MKKQSVVIIDDEEILVSMLRQWVSSLKSFTVVGTANRGPEGVAECRKHKPDIVLLDIEMPAMDGLAVAGQLRQEVPDADIIILTSHLNPFCVYEAARLGVRSYVSKTDSLKVLQEALCAVAAGEQYFSPLYQLFRVQKMRDANAFQKILTPKETAILILLSQGTSNSEIGEQLCISPLTVATHLRNIRSKLNAHNDRELIRYAQAWGLFPLHSMEG